MEFVHLNTQIKCFDCHKILKGEECLFIMVYLCWCLEGGGLFILKDEVQCIKQASPTEIRSGSTITDSDLVVPARLLTIL